jgi:hypothetical protein
MHSPTRSVDPAELGRAGGLRSGEVRRRQAERVRARQEDVRVKVGCEKLVQRRRELRRELAARRAAIVVEMRAKLREELRDLRVEVRRLKRQRARLASAQRANGK